jgi:hypothetical protein
MGGIIICRKCNPDLQKRKVKRLLNQPGILEAVFAEHISICREIIFGRDD